MGMFCTSGFILTETNTGPVSSIISPTLVLNSSRSSKLYVRGVARAFRHHRVVYPLRVGDGLAAGCGVALVVEQDVVEVGGLHPRDGRYRAQVHQQRAFGVEQDDLLARQAERQAERGGCRLPHRAAQRHVAPLVVAEVRPVAPRRPGGRHYRVPAMLLEGFEYVLSVYHAVSLPAYRLNP